jgi:uncharacterized protein YutE (UPF0331/DUF86 family)
VSPHRPSRSAAQLQESYSETVDAARRHFEQLEVAVAQFDPDLDEKALMAAWESDDPLERNRVGLLIGCFEKTYMLLMDLITLSVKLARRIGAIDDEKTAASELLVNAGVISRDDLEAIEKQREVRNTSQHIYVELSIPALRGAVLLQIEMTPPLIRNIVKWLKSFDGTEDRID